MSGRRLVAAAGLVVLASCATSSSPPSSAPSSAPSSPTATTACQSPPVDRSLPRQKLHIDEDGPRTLSEAWAASDMVVVGTVTCVRGGRRFLGGDAVEDPGGGWEEVVELDVDVDRVLAGSPSPVLQVSWLGFATSRPASDARTAVLEVAGVVVPSVGETYLLLLADDGEPWGVQPVSTQLGFLQVVDGEVAGQVPTGLASHRGRPVDDVVEDARRSPVPVPS